MEFLEGVREWESPRCNEVRIILITCPVDSAVYLSSERCVFNKLKQELPVQTFADIC